MIHGDRIQFRIFYEEEVTARTSSGVWRMHKNDPDTWPSTPHAHSEHLKLNLCTGEIWDARTKKRAGKLNEKALSDVRGKLGLA